MGVFTILFLLVIWIWQTLLFIKLGCIGGRPGAPYICDEAPALFAYIAVSIILIGLVIYILRSAIRLKKKMTLSEGIGLLISCCLALYWINKVMLDTGSIFGKIMVISIAKGVQNSLYYGLNVVLSALAIWSFRFIVYRLIERKKELDFWKKEYSKGPNQHKSGE